MSKAPVDRAANIPDRYGNRHRPENPSLFGALASILLAPIVTAIVSSIFLACAYITIGFVNQRLPKFDDYKTYWEWSIWAGGALGVLMSLSGYGNAVAAMKDYEEGFRAWEDQQERDGLEYHRRQAEAAKQRRQAQLEHDQKQARRWRAEQVIELEALVLRAQAQHALDADFFGAGAGTVGSLLPDFRRDLVRRYLAKLSLSDLGLLRESQHPAIRQIVGDGMFLPPAPPLKLPYRSPD